MREDFAAFTAEQDFGTPALYNGRAFNVILNREQTDAFGGGGLVADAPALFASFDTSNTPGLAEGSVLTIGGVAYTVAGGVQPDAGGWVDRLPLAGG